MSACITEVVGGILDGQTYAVGEKNGPGMVHFDVKEDTSITIEHLQGEGGNVRVFLPRNSLQPGNHLVGEGEILFLPVSQEPPIYIKVSHKRRGFKWLPHGRR